MNIHEYQAKSLLKEYGVKIADGLLATTAQEAVDAYKKIGADICIVKAQIHAGGRGKAGGVVLCRNEDDIKNATEKLLGKNLVTHQTGPKGQLVRKVFIQEGAQIEKEYYLSFVVDRRLGCVTVIASKEGGMDIEEVAKHTPERIVKIPIHPASGVMPYHGRFLGQALDLNHEQKNQLLEIVEQIYLFFIEKDASLVEINPLIENHEGDLMALDAKVSFDDNALPRHLDIEELRDVYEEDPSEVRARENDLSYIKMDGRIGCMVNGAGLAMATMDIINLYGEKPANFLDVGGGATKEKVQTAFSIILSDPDVKGIFVNIFGGIMRCDIIAEGIVAAAQEMNIHVPLVVRLQGTNMEKGREILASSGLKITPVHELDSAAQEIVNQVRSAA